MSWVTGNIGFHHIHHLNAKIPFYNLPNAMAEIQMLKEVSVTQWRLSDMYQNFSCHVWDENKNCLVPYSEIEMS
ncbi:fatty acid desaturase family protein [Pseudoalteromonas luteoviolacea B = ATCC 29581]|nr:fatty acid desaturase family protein [Pseudoalteromonas luteoviolacea B = ATCC 29581]